MSWSLSIIRIPAGGCVSSLVVRSVLQCHSHHLAIIKTFLAEPSGNCPHPLPFFSRTSLQ